MGLKVFILKRLIYSIALVFFVLTINFIIFQLMPGSPMEFYANQRLKPEQIQDVLRVYGLDQPVHIRYAKYIVGMLTGQFGYSYYRHNLVVENLIAFLPNTLLLVGGAAALSITIGIILGVIAAYKRGGIFDNVSVIASLTTYSLPSFWMGMILLLVFGVYLRWFPLAGSFPRIWAITPPANVIEFIGGRLYHLALPLITLTLFEYGGYLLLTRASMLETLSEDYVLTARAKGLSERTVLFKHALKNASLPLITNIALSFGFLLTGAIITEQVFTYPGLGAWLWESITYADYPVLQTMFFIIALCVIIANFIADIIYGIIDPRIKYG